MYSEKTIIRKGRCTPMFTTSLFTITKTGKQPQCPSTEEWIKIWYTCTMEYYSAMKKNEIMSSAATWMDREIIILSEVSQRKTNIVWNHLYQGSPTPRKQTITGPHRGEWVASERANLHLYLQPPPHCSDYRLNSTSCQISGSIRLS